MSYFPADIFQSDVVFPEKFDTILVPNFIHHFSEDKNVVLFKNIATWLKPHGHIVILDLCPPSATYSIWEGNTLARYFSMIMLVWSKKGKAYPVDEVEAILSTCRV